MSEKVMAVKKMDCDKNEIPREVKVHSALRPHVNVIPLLGVAHSRDGFTIYICMEMADKTLYHYLHKEKKMPTPQQSTEWAVQIARGMQHLHKHKVAHRDLKSLNILLFKKEGILKLGSFGSARFLERTATMTGMMVGRFRWMAPEFYSKKKIRGNLRCDVFSYGMVLYEIFAHKTPFSVIRDHRKVSSLICEGSRPSIPPMVPLKIKTLMQSCWMHDPHRRPTFGDILQVGY